MMLLSETVKSYLDAQGVDYKIHMTDGPTITAQDAAIQLQVPLSTIIKSIVFTDQDGLPVLAIVTGDRRVDRRKLSAVIGGKVRIATAEVTRMLTGFEVGTMPPLGHGKRITTVIDQAVMSFGKVYGGSGAPKALIEIDPRDIARLTDAKVTDICE